MQKTLKDSCRNTRQKTFYAAECVLMFNISYSIRRTISVLFLSVFILEFLKHENNKNRLSAFLYIFKKKKIEHCGSRVLIIMESADTFIEHFFSQILLVLKTRQKGFVLVGILIG